MAAVATVTHDVLKPEPEMKSACPDPTQSGAGSARLGPKLLGHGARRRCDHNVAIDAISLAGDKAAVRRKQRLASRFDIQSASPNAALLIRFRLGARLSDSRAATARAQKAPSG